ncbi:MAG: hypothetical protein J0M00_20820 [Burkholderiales bacterium]|nr:hypothetical protein [Burkholderiales bacterium]
MVTVYACCTCHDSYKLDDEYFRVTLSVRDDLPIGSDSQFLRDQTRKTLRDPAATAFRKAIRASTVRVPIHSPSGVYLGHATALKIDTARVKRTAERIVRGLYGKFLGHPLPQAYDLQVVLLDLQRDMSALKNPEVQEVLMLLGKCGKHRAFGQALDVWYATTDDDAHSSFWVIRLHGAFGFLGFTVPRD